MRRSTLGGDGECEKPVRFSGIHIHIAFDFKAS